MKPLKIHFRFGFGKTVTAIATAIVSIFGIIAGVSKSVKDKDVSADIECIDLGPYYLYDDSDPCQPSPKREDFGPYKDKDDSLVTIPQGMVMFGDRR